MERAKLLNGTALAIGTIVALGASSGASAKAALLSAAVQASATDPARPMAGTPTGEANTGDMAQPASSTATAGAAPTSGPAAPGIKSAAGANAEIIVTARKRNEKLLDVPISVQAFSREEIKVQGIADLQTLKDRAGFQFPPQVSNGPAGRFAGVLIFRGLQSNNFSQSYDNSGSLFVDGVYISGGVQSVNTADVERIEVLKGPQSVYFGRSTFGGAVNFVTRNPSESFGGEVNVRATARGSVDADASVEGGILPGVTARLTGFLHEKVAQYHATDGGALGKEETLGLVGTVYIKPTDNSFVRLRASYQEDDDSAPVFAFIGANQYAAGACAGQTFPGFNSATGAQRVTLTRNYFCNGVPSLDSIGTGVITQNTKVPAALLTAISANQNGAPGSVNAAFIDKVPSIDHFGLRRDTLFLSAQGGYTFDSGAGFAFNLGSNRQDSIAINDVDKTDTLFGFIGAVAFRSRDFTADARFNTDPSRPIRMLLGASYYTGKIQLNGIDQSLFSPVPSRSGNFQNDKTETPAIYGSLDFDILPTLTFTGEARYQEDKITSYNQAGVAFSSTSKDFLPRAILQFKPNSDTNAYVSYAKGTQPARVNTGFIQLSARPFAAQAIAYVQSNFPGVNEFSATPSLDAYEIGLKQRLFDGRLSYTLAIYQNDWHNAPTSSALFNPISCFPPAVPAATVDTATCPLSAAGSFNVIGNEARIRGLEFAVTARLAEFTIDASADYKRTKWRRYANSGLNVFTGIVTPGVYRGDGNHLARVPNLTGTLAGTYRGTFGADWGWFARAEGIYTGRSWDSDINVFKTDDFVRTNASLGFTRENLTIELFATNLLNDKHFDAIANTVELTGNFTQRALAVVPAQKREFGLRTQFKF